MAKKKARTPLPPRPVQAPKARPGARQGGGAAGGGFADNLGLGQRNALYAVSGAGIVALIVVVAIVALGGGGNAIADSQVATLLKTAGCTFRTVKGYVPKGQGTHVNSLTAKLPWNTDPPSNGQHYPQWAVWGFYTQAVNPRMVVHDEEHGGVIYWWGPQVPAATVTQLRALYNEQPVGTFGTPYAGLGAKIAITAWTGNPSTYQQNGDYGQGHIGICTRYTAATHTAFQAFRKAYRGHGPEGIPLSADHPGMGP